MNPPFYFPHKQLHIHLDFDSQPTLYPIVNQQRPHLFRWFPVFGRIMHWNYGILLRNGLYSSDDDDDVDIMMTMLMN